jgi:hypothetical protein
MKAILKRFDLEGDNSHEGFHLGSTLVVVLLCLLFMGTSIFLMVTNA